MQGLETIVVPPGTAGRAWLSERVVELKAGDPLAAVTVVVPSNHAGLWLRRQMARGGYANVRFSVLGRLAEPLGAPALTREGRTPLTSPLENALIRRAIAAAGSPFGEVGTHPALVQVLRDLFRDVRSAEIDGERLEALAGWGRMAAAAIGAFRAFEVERDRAKAYDDRDLLDAASAALAAGHSPRLREETGAVIVFRPEELAPAAERFLMELGRHTDVEVARPEIAEATPKVAVTVTPDAAEEVRTAVRSLLAMAEAGGDISRTAIVYRDSDPYAALVRDTLDASGIPWAGIDGRPLLDSWAGRSLAGFLRLPAREFRRVDVLGWLGALPVADPGAVSAGEWDRLSRSAGIVAGIEQWRGRLKLALDDRAVRLEGKRHAGDSEASIAHVEREMKRIERMGDYLEAVFAASSPPADRTWPGFARWAKAARHRFAPLRDGWPEREVEADEMVEDLLDELAAAGRVEAETDPETFLTAFESAADARRQAQGRLGAGVTVGPLGALAGLDFDHVFVVGCTERALPKPAAPDPVFPPSGQPDPLGRVARQAERERLAWKAALASAPDVVLSVPAWDADVRPVYPSSWLLEHLPRASAEGVRRGLVQGIRFVPSPDAGIGGGAARLSLAEHRAAEARAARDGLEASGLALRTDLPLGRHLEVRAARLSHGFTEFDGNLEDAGDVDLIAQGLAGRTQSPSRLEDWAECGFRYLLARVLQVQETERPEQDIPWSVDAATRGSLYHEVLETFFRRLAADGRPGPGEPYTAADDELIIEIARAAFARLESTGQAGNPLAWENESHAILADLRLFLIDDAERRQADGLVPRYFEQGFGEGDDEWPAVEVELESGRTVRVRGRIDRVDVGPDPDAPERARVVDYKTGRSNKYAAIKKDPLGGGALVQPAVYAAALRARFPGVAPESGYWFISSRGKFEWMAAPEAGDRLRNTLSVIDRGVAAGEFPQVPGDESMRSGRDGWENCFYCAYDRICPTGRDAAWRRKSGGALVRTELTMEAPDGGD